MAIFKFPSPVLPEGTTFVFGSWVCVANGAGGFRRHIVNDTIKLKTLPERLDNFVDNLGELPFFDSARETEAESVTTIPFSTLWIRATTSDCRTVRTPIVQDIHLYRDYMIVLLSAMRNVLPHIGACVQQKLK
jgi:hypothetical protein